MHVALPLISSMEHLPQALAREKGFEQFAAHLLLKALDRNIEDVFEGPVVNVIPHCDLFMN